MARVLIEHLTHAFRNPRETIHALRDVSFEAADGEFLVLLGPSGCGKTTTLRLIAGLDEPSAGTIRIDDRLVNRVPPRDRDVAMVFQNLALYPHMTVFENMGFGLKMRGCPRREIRSRVGEAAERLGIASLLHRKPSKLSGGEKQRVAIGRAIVRKPRVFLFDEPLSSLDAALRLQWRSEIRALQRELGATMIYVTHDQEEAMTLADRLVVMKNGTVRQLGAPMEVYERPSDRFVAGFLGSPRMNFLTGRVESQSGSLSFSGGFGGFLLDEASSAKLARHAGAEIVLGLRPQHVEVDPGGQRPTACVEGIVRDVQTLGDRINVHVALGDRTTIIGRTRTDRAVLLGDRVAAALRLDAAHYFETGDGGRRIA